MSSSSELDRARERWRRKHRELGLPDPSGLDEVEPTGLARRVEELSTRIVILPGDPFSTELQFDDEFWGWWDERRETPFGGSLHWNDTVPSIEAAVGFRGYGEGWDTYLALHRHGGVELGTSDVYQIGETGRCFRLIRTVGLIWVVLDTQSEVLRRVGVDGPWQVVLALINTQGAWLGDVGTGWAEPPDRLGCGTPPCPEPHVVIRRELEDFPVEADAIQGLVFDLGGRIEDAWGVKQRRFLEARGELQGQFNPRKWRF